MKKINYLATNLKLHVQNQRVPPVWNGMTIYLELQFVDSNGRSNDKNIKIFISLPFHTILSPISGAFLRHNVIRHVVRQQVQSYDKVMLLLHNSILKQVNELIQSHTN